MREDLGFPAGSLGLQEKQLVWRGCVHSAVHGGGNTEIEVVEGKEVSEISSALKLTVWWGRETP